VLFWAQAIQDPETGSSFRERFYVDGEPFLFEKVDDLTVRVVTAVPVSDLLQRICVPVIPEHYFVENGIGNAQIMNSKANTEGCIGTGPFKVAEYRRGEAVILEPSENHWRGKRPYLDQIVLRVVPDTQSLVNAAINEEVDWFRINTADIPKVEDLDYISLNSVLFDATRYIVLNCQSPLLSDKRTRQALLYALDRNAMMSVEERGLGVVLDAPWPQVVSAYEPLTAYDQDYARASTLLADVGWVPGADGVLVADTVAGVDPGTVFELEYWATTASDKIPTLVQAYLTEVGVKVTQRLVDSSTWAAHLYGPQRDYDITSTACGHMGSDAGSYRPYFATGDAATSFCGYHSDAVYALFEEAAALTDPDARDAKYREAALILWDEVPALFGWQRPRTWACNTRVHEEDAVVNIHLYRYYEYPEQLWVEK
jgi:peptide/nickel transport system substrate-binding protein